MRAREGVGAASLLAVAGFLWGIAGLIGSSDQREPVTGANRIGASAEAPQGRALSSRISGLDWGPAGSVEAAVGLSLVPGLDVFLGGDGRLRPQLAATRTFAPPPGWARVSTFARGRPVAEPPLWLVLSLAGGAWWSRQRFQARLDRPGSGG